MLIKIEVSARHIHFTRQDINVLFGENYQLRQRNKLSQADDFASQETVSVKTEKGELELRIIGPERAYSQVELSITDTIKLGIDTSLKLSGDIKSVPRVNVLGPNGAIQTPVIIAKRHLHLSKEQASELGIEDGKICKIKIEGERGLVFDNVIARVGEGFDLVFHIDTDEANACGLGKTCEEEGEIIL
ncbi:MAG: phosphate propanoyltransferase [Candidatus Paceibacterota bacterium]|jgi:putative phosphotransacetylase